MLTSSWRQSPLTSKIISFLAPVASHNRHRVLANAQYPLTTAGVSHLFDLGTADFLRYGQTRIVPVPYFIPIS